MDGFSKDALIVVFVRHKAGCKYAGDEFAKSCRCRKHFRWSLNGKQYRRTANTRSWEEADRRKYLLAAQLRGEEVELPKSVAVSTERAIELFLKDKTNQELTPGIIGKYERELGRFREFAERHSVFTVTGVTRELLIDYQATWAKTYESSLTRLRVLGRLRTFLRFCFDSRWLDRIPKTATIKADEPPTLPLTAKEFERLLATVPKTFPDAVRAGRVRGLVLTMRWSGLSIRDTVTLRRDEILYDKKKKLHKVITSRQKTDAHVYAPIPHEVAIEILGVVNQHPDYLFWNTGTGKEESAVINWQHNLRALFKDAGIQSEGHMLSHRLRDTFAVDLLEKGVPLEEVSKLLGHESIKTTEKHYAKWVKGRQDRLDKIVSATWKQSAPII